MDVPRPAPRGCLTEIDSPPFTAVCSGNTVSLRDEKYGHSGRMDIAEDILIALAVSFVCALILGQWLRAASERVRRPEHLSASYIRRN